MNRSSVVLILFVTIVIALTLIPHSTPPALTLLNNNKVYAAHEDGLNVPILMFHSVRPAYPSDTADLKMFRATPEVFDKELTYLEQNNYHVITFDDLIAAFNGKEDLPSKPIILTFDDGWHNQYEYAFPILKKHNIKATFFVFTNPLGLPHYLSWDEIKEMDTYGMMFEAHTKSHPYLNKITDDKVLTEEIVGSKKVLEEKLGKPVNYFAYPFGVYNDHTVEVVKQAGFLAARSTTRGIVQMPGDLYSLKIINVNDNFQGFITNVEVK